MAIQISGTEVISNSRGLNNIASVDATTAASITAAGVGGGGTLDFTATGAIASGDVVGLRSDGTVEVISGTSQTESLGTQTTYNSSASTNAAAVYDSANEKVVIFFTDQGDSYKGKAVVGTVSGTSISFGTPVQFSTGVYYSIGAAYDANSGKIVVGYSYYDGTDHEARAIVGTVSGTSISFGTHTVVYNATNIYSWVDVVYDASSTKVVVALAAGTPKTVAYVGTVSGTSISFGSQTQITTGRVNYYINSVYDTANSKIVYAYADIDDSNKGKAIVGTVSGSSISFGSITTFETGGARYITADYDTQNSKVIIAYADLSNSYTGNMIVGTVSGTSISFGSPVTFTANGLEYAESAYDAATGKFAVFYRGNTFGNATGRYVTATVSGTTPTVSSETVFTSDTFFGYQNGATFDSGQNRIVLNSRDIANSGYGAAFVLRNAGTISNNDTWIGISTEAISNAATGTVTIVGGVNEQQTGLTTGSTYYVAADGSLSTTDSGYKVGKAISATKILITEGNT